MKKVNFYIQCESNLTTWPPVNVENYELDDTELGKLFRFYILANPSSAQGHISDYYGWTGQQLKNLKSRIFVELNGNGEKQILGFSKKEDFQKSLRNQLLQDKICLSPARIIFTINKTNIVESMLSHIRNSFAHGNFGAFLDSEKQKLLWLEDKYRGNVNMRGILSLQFLLNMRDIITNGPNRR